MIIGGCEHFHGAPILCALGAENSGADLIFPFIPRCHAEAAKQYSLNFIIRTFEKDHLTEKDVKPILHFSQNVDAVVIGPGLGDDPETKKAIKSLLKKLEKPTVIDADALIYTNILPKVSVLTPHRGEFKTISGEDATIQSVQKWAKHLETTILVKGPEDIIAGKTKVIVNHTGNPLMTVGGTGDVLSGLIGGLMAQGLEPAEACRVGANTMGLAGDYLAETKASLRAIDLADLLPVLLLETDEEHD